MMPAEVKAALDAMEVALDAAGESAPAFRPEVAAMVEGLSFSAHQWGVSPVEGVVIVAGTLTSAARGMACALDGDLHIAEITDREALNMVIAGLRGAADIFEAMLKAGRS